MDCEEARALIEKLADDEASEPEAARVRSHLESCPGCRSDHAALLSLSRAASLPLPEPPPGYFDSLPERILARLDEEGRDAPAATSSWRRLFAPDALRFGALAAALVAAVAVGLVVEREGLLEQREPPPPSAERAAPPAESSNGAETSKTVEPADQPESPRAPEPTSPAAPALRQAPAGEPAVARDERTRSRAEEGVESPREAEEVQSAATAGAVEGASARSQSEPSRREAFSEKGTSVDALSVEGRSAAGDDCERWRRYLQDTVPESEDAVEARYRLASCSIERFRREGTEALRETAVAEAQAFLEVEGEGPRATEIREALEQLR